MSYTYKGRPCEIHALEERKGSRVVVKFEDDVSERVPLEMDELVQVRTGASLLSVLKEIKAWTENEDVSVEERENGARYVLDYAATTLWESKNALITRLKTGFPVLSVDDELGKDAEMQKIIAGTQPYLLKKITDSGVTVCASAWLIGCERDGALLGSVPVKQRSAEICAAAVANDVLAAFPKVPEIFKTDEDEARFLVAKRERVEEEEAEARAAEEKKRKAVAQERKAKRAKKAAETA